MAYAKAWDTSMSWCTSVWWFTEREKYEALKPRGSFTPIWHMRELSSLLRCNMGIKAHTEPRRLPTSFEKACYDGVPLEEQTVRSLRSESDRPEQPSAKKRSMVTMKLVRCSWLFHYCKPYHSLRFGHRYQWIAPEITTRLSWYKIAMQLQRCHPFWFYAMITRVDSWELPLWNSCPCTSTAED